MERGKSGKQPLWGEMVTGTKRREIEEEEASTWINKPWCLDLGSKRSYGSFPRSCLLKIHEMSLVLPTYHSVPNSQTLALAPTSPVTYRSKLQPSLETSTWTVTSQSREPKSNQWRIKTQNISSISLFLMQKLCHLFLGHPGDKPWSHHPSSCEDFLLFW